MDIIPCFITITMTAFTGKLSILGAVCANVIVIVLVVNVTVGRKVPIYIAETTHSHFISYD